MPISKTSPAFGRSQPSGGAEAGLPWQKVLNFAAASQTASSDPSQPEPPAPGTLGDYIQAIGAASNQFLIAARPVITQSVITQSESQSDSVYAPAHLNPVHLEATRAYLQQASHLIERTTVFLASCLVQAYCAQLQDQAFAEKPLPYFHITPIEENTVHLQTNLEGERLLSNLRRFVQQQFTTDHLWEQGAREIWARLIHWAITTLQNTSGESLSDLTPEDFNRRLYELLFEQAPHQTQAQLHLLEDHYAQTLTRQFLEALDLSNYPLSELELLLGITAPSRQKTVPMTEAQLSQLGTVAAIPTGLPIVSSISAQLQTDLWQADASGIAHFRYRSKHNLNNYLEHYITSPGDIEALPWEAAEQIINKFGFNTVKLQFILAAYAMRQSRPWESTFTLKATDIIKELGWDKNHNTNLPTKRNEVASIAYALSCLLVKAVWVEGKGKHQVDSSTPIGRMWEVLIDPHGQLNWTTGRIDAPDEVYITVRPGLWTAHFLNQAGSKAKEALYQFGYLALNILKLDPYHDELTLRLAIHLTLDVRLRIREQNPHEYQVQTLLAAVLSESTLIHARQNSEKARSLFNRWNRAIQLLAELGWQPAEAETAPAACPIFYCHPYPQWLIPDLALKKPRGWIDEWLGQKLVIRPPDPILSRTATLTPKSSRQPTKPEGNTPLTGARIKAARQEKGWTQTKLAGILDIHQSLIAKIESGNRSISPALEALLRQVLSL